MKVVILAGGWGTRLGNRTDLIPKPMVKIGNRPILWHIMKIYSFFGYKDFIICLGVKGDVIKDYFFHYAMRSNDYTINFSTGDIEYYNKQSEKDWKVSLIDTGLNTLKGGRIKRVEKYLDPDMNMLTYGDGVANINLKELIEFHKSHGKILTITGVNPPSRFGEITERNGKVIEFQEKPQVSVGMINGGFMVFNNELLNYLKTDEDCDLEKDTFGQLTIEGEVMVYKHRGNWDCMDHERDVEYLNKLWNTKKAFWKIWE